MRDPRLRLSLPLATLLLAAPPVVADAPSTATTDDDDTDAVATVRDEVLVEADAPYLPEEASTFTKTSQPLHGLPASVSTVSHEILAEQNALILRDALRNVPGVNAQSNAGVHDFFFLRGFDSLSSGLVMTDGAAEPEASFYQLYNVDKVEVVRGPAGFLYGGNPLAGAVNLVTKRPVAQSFSRVALSWGSHATTHDTVDVNWASPEGTAGLRVNGLYAASDGYRDDKASAVTAVNPVFTAALGENTRLTVAAEAARSDFEPDSGIPLLFGSALPEVSRRTSYQAPDDFSDQERGRLRIDLETRLGDRVTLRDKAYYTRLDWESKGTLLNGAFPTPFGTFVARSRTSLDDTQELFGNQLDVVWSFRSGAVSHELVTGLEVQRLTDEFTLGVSLLPVVSLVDPMETGEPEIPLPFGAAADATTTVVAPYVLDQIQIGERFSLFAGARYDSIDFEDDVPGLDASWSQVSPFGGVLFAPNPRWSFYLSFSEAFAPPSTTVAGDGREPEEGRQTEAGVKTTLLGGKVRAALSVYRLDKDNIAIPDQTGFTTQLGEQRSEGVEVDLGGDLGEGLHWALQYAWTDAELLRFAQLVQTQTGFVFVDRSGNDPAYTPEHLASLWLSKRWEGGLGIAGGVRYVGEQEIAEDNVFSIDAATVLDAAVSYGFGRYTATLRLNNLTDEDYETRGFGSSSVLPADGFNLLAGLQIGL